MCGDIVREWRFVDLVIGFPTHLPNTTALYTPSTPRTTVPKIIPIKHVTKNPFASIKINILKPYVVAETSIRKHTKTERAFSDIGYVVQKYVG